jgi:hypothetical protein
MPKFDSQEGDRQIQYLAWRSPLANIFLSASQLFFVVGAIASLLD